MPAVLDISGQRFGRLVAVRFLFVEKKNSRWLFRCDCGEEVIRTANGVKGLLKTRYTPSCGCAMTRSSKIPNLSGKRFGRLTALRLTERKPTDTDALWVCRCDCGNEHITRTTNLTSGTSKSCGCLKRTIGYIVNLRHGQSKTRIHRIWMGMKDRCSCGPHRRHHAYYSGLGIRVCDEWSNSFEAFRDWALGNGYSDGLTLDRIDNDGNYAPSNCRWVTMAEQAKNRGHKLFIDGLPLA